MLTATALAGFVPGTTPAWAEIKGLELIAPSSPGSGYDQLARAIQSVLIQEKLATGIEVKNIAGGGGTVGLAQYITTKKRGASAMIFGFALVGGILTTKSPVSLNSLVPLARLMAEPDVIVVRKNSDIQTMADLVAKLKANPAEVRWAGGSIGGIDHVLVGLIAKAVGVDPAKVNFIVHAGGGEVMASVLGGHTTVALSGYEEFRSQIDAGLLRLIAISSEQRTPGIDAPTLKESGVAVALMNWRGLMGHPDCTSAARGKRAFRHGRQDGGVAILEGGAEVSRLARLLPRRSRVRSLPEGGTGPRRRGAEVHRPAEMSPTRSRRRSKCGPHLAVVTEPNRSNGGTEMDFVVLPGDGIGPEISEATVQVLEVLNRRLSLGITFETHEVGFASLEKEGTTFPEKVLDAARAADGIILGPVSHLDYPPREQGGINPSGISGSSSTFTPTSARAAPARASPITAARRWTW